jgi:nicotinamidase-related amidase
MDPAGRLYVKDLQSDGDLGAAVARPAIERAVGWMRDHCDVMVFTGDWHGYGDEEIDVHAPDPEEGTYPPHCMGRSDDPAEQEGAWIIDSVRPMNPVVLELDADESDAMRVARLAVEESRSVFVKKTRFDVFRGNGATEDLVRSLEQILDRDLEVYVAGVARDVCVTAAVDGLADRGYPVVAIEDATWGLGLEPESQTLARWAAKGRVTTTAQLPT